MFFIDFPANHMIKGQLKDVTIQRCTSCPKNNYLL